MRVLALDTTTPAASAAIVDDTVVRAELRGDPARPHAERLPGDLVRLLDQARLTSADIDVFAVVVGPGSFTGLRIGIATMQGMAFVHGRRIVPISALEALGEAASAGLPVGTLAGAWMDAHRRQVFSALWRVSGREPYAVGRLTNLEAPSVEEPRVILARWASLTPAPAAIAGDGASLYAEAIAASAALIVHPALATIAALMAVRRAQAGQTVDAAGVQPLYVRRPDAEVLRDAAREATLNAGRDADQARSALASSTGDPSK